MVIGNVSVISRLRLSLNGPEFEYLNCYFNFQMDRTHLGTELCVLPYCEREKNIEMYPRIDYLEVFTSKIEEDKA